MADAVVHLGKIGGGAKTGADAPGQTGEGVHHAHLIDEQALGGGDGALGPTKVGEGGGARRGRGAGRSRRSGERNGVASGENQIAGGIDAELDDEVAAGAEEDKRIVVRFGEHGEHLLGLKRRRRVAIQKREGVERPAKKRLD